MKKIVIIGANSFQNPLIEKAKEMGYETHVFAWKDGSIGEKTADYFYPISIVEKDNILEMCKKIKPEAVVSIASDLANITVQYVAEKLGLTCNSSECIRITTNKYDMRAALHNNRVPTPRFVKVSVEDDLEASIKALKLPVIVKPTDRSGSRGITKVEILENLQSAVQAAIENSFEKNAIIEEYIDGDEYSCECISYKGEHYILAITKKYTTGFPHFIETGHLEPAPLEKDMENKVKVEIVKALDALQICYGASHSEFKITSDGEIRIIEIGSRMGGDCIGSHLVKLSTGHDFIESVIRIACGEEPKIEKDSKTRYAGIKFVFSQEDYEGYLYLKERYPELIVFESEMEEIGSRLVVDSSTRFGYYIMASNADNIIKDILER